MHGISSSGKDRIKELVDRLFDSMALALLGRIPSLRNKDIYFDPKTTTLGSIFIAALGNRRPNPVEEDALRSILDSSHGYVESLKNTTRSNVIEQVDGLVKQANIKGDKVSPEQIQALVREHLKKAKDSLQTIVESESTKIRNMALAIAIIGIAISVYGVQDPTVFFVLNRTKNTCQWCIRNHLLDDGITPRLFKMSEVKGGFLSTDEKKNGHVSVCGLHPRCACSLSHCPPGHGFKSGKLQYIHPGYNGYEWQKANS
jgi:hypothetical protein